MSDRLNRAQRRSANVYLLDTLYRKIPSDSALTDALYQANQPTLINFDQLRMAEIEDVVFLSVPITTTVESCEHLKEMTRVAFKDQKVVMVFSHNIELLRARKLGPKEAGRVLGHVQDHEVEARTAM